MLTLQHNRYIINKTKGILTMAIGMLALAGATAKLGGGLMAYNEAMKQAGIIEAETAENAKIEAESVKSQISKNYVEFAKAGVALEGSPLFAIEENIETGKKNVANVIRSGKAKASQMRSSGRAALFNAIGSTAGGMASAG